LINADEIAAELWPEAQSDHAFMAAQVAEKQRREFIAEGKSFISETVFSHPSEIQLVSDASEAGYLVHLHVIMVPVDLAVRRVLEGVERGGHSVPEQKVRERYERLFGHLVVAIGIADRAEVFDNSSARKPFRLCASYEYGQILGQGHWPEWTPNDLRNM
jgi:predicted ABC-type ATPase